MNPKKVKETAVETAQELGISSFMVEDILSFYWKELRRTLSKAENINIQVVNLGHFKSKSIPRLTFYLNGYRKMLETIRESAITKPEVYQRPDKFTALEKKIELISNVIRLVTEEKNQKLQFKINKYEQLNKNLEEQRKNS